VLTKTGTYTLQDGNLVFKRSTDLDMFNQKLSHARDLGAEFLRAYWQMRHAQQAMVAQVGLQGTEYDPNHPAN
jgi:hypothetical protein